MNETGGLVFSSENYPYGEDYELNENQEDETKYKFTGKEKDESNFYYFGARYYDPSIGRFITTDPLAFKYPSLSPYNYCGNNPIIRTDPDGMRWDWDEEKQQWVETKDGDPMAYYSETTVTAEEEDSGDKGRTYAPAPNRRIGFRYRQSGDRFSKGRSGWTFWNWPLAGPNDPWYHKLLRGTGDISTDQYYFTFGILGSGVVGGALAYGGLTALFTYGPTVWLNAQLSYHYISSQFYAAHTLATLEAKTLLASMQARLIAGGTYLTAQYLLHKPEVDRAAGSIGRFVTPLSRGCWATDPRIDFRLNMVKIMLKSLQ